MFVPMCHSGVEGVATLPRKKEPNSEQIAKNKNLKYSPPPKALLLGFLPTSGKTHR